MAFDAISDCDRCEIRMIVAKLSRNSLGKRIENGVLDINLFPQEKSN
jgi:hypothetical protein